MNLRTDLLDPDLHGQQPLWRVFWVEGVLLSHLLFLGVVLAYAKVSSAALAGLLTFFLLYTLWIVRRVWINADNVDHESWGDLARYLTVAWALNAVLVAVFMLLAHLAGEPFPLPF